MEMWTRDETLVGVVDNSMDRDIEVKIAFDADYARQCQGTGSGSDAIHAALRAPGVAPPPGRRPRRPSVSSNGFAVCSRRLRRARPDIAWPRTGRGPPRAHRAATGSGAGWGYASMNPGSIQADNGEGLTLGIIGLVNKDSRGKLDDWGALRAWAWGASRLWIISRPTRLSMPGTSPWKAIRDGARRPSWRWRTTSVLDRLCKFVRRGRREVAPPQLGGNCRERRRHGEYHWMAGNFLKYAGPIERWRSACGFA